MNRFGFVRITSVSIGTAIANPEANASEIIRVLDQVRDTDVILFPELCLTGYTCADLFGQSALLQGALREIGRIAASTAGRKQLVVLGMPVPVENSLFNSAAVLSDGKVLGVIPKQSLPNYKEFYEKRGSVRPTAPSRRRSNSLADVFHSESIFSSPSRSVMAFQ